MAAVLSFLSEFLSDEALRGFAQHLPWPVLLLAFPCILFVLAKAADLLVDAAVQLAHTLRLSPFVVGATVVSLGTTFPEFMVASLAAWQGHTSLALGNAVGSILCNTGLVLGLAIFLGRIPLAKKGLRKQSWLLLFSALALVLACLPWRKMEQIWELGGHLPQAVGFVFIAFLVVYLFLQVKFARVAITVEPSQSAEQAQKRSAFLALTFGFLCLALASKALIVLAVEGAARLQLPESVLAVTLLSFGCSVPELVTVLSAVRKNLGEVALGNVLGANILNIFLVVGVSATLQPEGLQAEPNFFKFSFPFMLLLIGLLHMGLLFSRRQVERKYGIMLLLIYLAEVLWNLKSPFL